MDGLGVASIFTTAIADFGPELLLVVGAAVGIGVILLAAKRGWGLVKKFTS